MYCRSFVFWVEWYMDDDGWNCNVEFSLVCILITLLDQLAYWCVIYCVAFVLPPNVRFCQHWSPKGKWSRLLPARPGDDTCTWHTLMSDWHIRNVTTWHSCSQNNWPDQMWSDYSVSHSYLCRCAVGGGDSEVCFSSRVSHIFVCGVWCGRHPAAHQFLSTC